MAHLDKRNHRMNWLGTTAVWLSGISTFVYFYSSYTVKNYFMFVTEYFNKTIEILSR